jgi:hypothetical protein
MSNFSVANTMLWNEYDNTIVISLNIISKELRLLNIDAFYDLLSKHYKNQTIVFKDFDGINFYVSGFLDLLKRVQIALGIPDKAIIFESVSVPPKQYGHRWPEYSVPEIFFNGAGASLGQCPTFDLTETKFVGALAASRFTLLRWLTLYELDQAFPNDTYLTFRHTVEEVKSNLINCWKNYTDELDWLAHKKFDPYDMDNHLPQNAQQLFNGLEATANYSKICSKYAIEIIMETDEFASDWFTEKTSKCLAAGRPFVLMAGPGSLQNLKKQGYQTFSDIIDEHYDQATTPTLRLKAIIQSLKILYDAPDKNKLITDLFEISKHNREIYNAQSKKQTHLKYLNTNTKYIMLNPKFDYQPVPRVTIEGKRYYATPDGNKLPSVTTILDKTKSEESKQALQNWRARVGTEAAQAITTEAANRGTRMHTYLEQYVKEGAIRERGTNPFSWASHAMAHTVAQHGLKNVSEFWGIEVPLYFPKVYAGTTDGAGIHLNEEAILDYKQTNRPKKREWIDDYFVQLCAYAEAHNELYGTRIKKGVVLMCVQPRLDEQMNMISPPEYQEFVLEGSEFDRYRDLWWKKVEQYYLLNM